MSHSSVKTSANLAIVLSVCQNMALLKFLQFKVQAFWFGPDKRFSMKIKMGGGGRKKHLLFILLVLGSSLLYGLLLRSSIIPSF